MSSKLLWVVIILIVALGGFMFLGNKAMSPTTEPSGSMQSQQATPVATEEAQVVNIILAENGFTPKDITAKAGTKIVWINKSGKTATVDSEDHPTHRLYPFLNLGEFPSASTLEVTIQSAGKYSYHNHLDASQTGTITVE